MKFAPASGRLEPALNPFDDDYLRDIIRSLVVAWRVMKMPKPKEIEDRITFRLAGRLQHDPEFANLPFDIVPQYWLLDLHGKRLGRLDLRFKHRRSQQDYFAFEAKRLHVTYPGGQFKREYTGYSGKQGMMCFILGKYSTGLRAAGMLGYVMDGDTTGAWNGVATHLQEKRAELRLSLNSQLIDSTIVELDNSAKSGTRVGETAHNMTSHELRMFHVLLPRTR
jgi:hypothetical protein